MPARRCVPPLFRPARTSRGGPVARCCPLALVRRVIRVSHTRSVRRDVWSATVRYARDADARAAADMKGGPRGPCQPRVVQALAEPG